MFVAVFLQRDCISLTEIISTSMVVVSDVPSALPFIFTENILRAKMPMMVKYQ